jgi:hypothetical protein
MKWKPTFVIKCLWPQECRVKSNVKLTEVYANWLAWKQMKKDSGSIFAIQ